MTSAETLDRTVRLRAFDFLSEQTSIHGEVLPWAILSTGFLFEGKRVPLIGQQGIFKPAVLPEIPISMRTAPMREGENRPYDDGLDERGLLNYRYRGTDPQHRDILVETDGPMLRHGLQEIAGQRIHLPRDERLPPRSDFLEERYATFRKAG